LKGCCNSFNNINKLNNCKHQLRWTSSISEVTSDIINAEDSLKYQDYFGVHKLFTVKDLFDARVHLGHKSTALDPTMNQFVFGDRFGMSIIDLDQTTLLLRQALNFIAHISYRNGLILFVCRQPQLVHMVDKTAQECGEYSVTRAWKTDVFTAPNLTFDQEVRLPDLVIMVHTRESEQYGVHRAITDAAKVGIPTVGLVDTDCNPNIITYPIPGNDDSISSVSLMLDLFKKSIMAGKQQRQNDNITN